MNKDDTIKALTSRFVVGVGRTTSDEEDQERIFASPGVLLIPLLFASSAVLNRLDLDSDYHAADEIVDPVNQMLIDASSDPDILSMMTAQLTESKTMRVAFSHFLEGVVMYQEAMIKAMTEFHEVEASATVDEVLTRIMGNVKSKPH